MWRMMWMVPRVQLKGWKIRKWRWRMMVGVRDHQRLVLMGRIAHEVSTMMKRRLRTESTGATAKHLRWWWWKVPTFKIEKPTILLLLVGIVMGRWGNTACEIFRHCRACYITES